MTAAAASASTPWRGGWRDGLSYGALGLPLAFVALPLYVVLPAHYASEFGVPLAALGALLLGARALDAVADPWIGRLADGWFAHSRGRALVWSAAAAVLLAIGFRALFFPAVQGTQALLWWCGTVLALSYFCYSVLGIVHQSWGARLGGSAAQRARIVSWREGSALVGVVLASVLPALAGVAVTGLVFSVVLLLGLVLLARAPRPLPPPRVMLPVSFAQPLRTPAFRRLLGIYLVNGIAAAVPATLVLFFIRDRLQAPAWEPLFLAAYFASGALSMPLWVRAVGRFGLSRSWLAGMVLAVLGFGWAALLGAGDVWAYAAVCVVSGAALGADLSLPGALLAGVVQRAGHAGRLEGAYFGWWNFATKLNLAVAAGISLPLLGALGYAPGSRGETALGALTLAYCVLPCLLKIGAALLLWTRWIPTEEG